MVDTIKFSEFADGGDLANNETTVGVESGANARFNNPWTFLAPGSTGDRPIPAASMYYRLRLNTTLEVYEYYDPTIPIWTQLSGTGTGTVNPGVANDIAFYAASGQAVSPIAGAANSVLVTNGSEAPSLSTTLPSGLSIPGAAITASTAALLSGSVVAAPASGADLVNKTYADGLFAAGVQSLTGTTNQISFSSPTGNVTASLPQDIALGSTPTFGGLTLSSIPLGGASGGTGVNNGVNTITLAGSLSTVGAFASTFTMTGATSVTFPTSGTLLTSAGAVTSLAATANQTTVSAATGAVTTGLASNAILPGTAGVTLPQGNTAARAGSAGTLRFNTQSLVFESTVDGVAWATIDTSASGDVDSITGTANQVIASSPTGNVTLSLPQSIATTSSVQFDTVSFSDTTHGIAGTATNNNAAAGYVGEVISSTVLSGAATSISSNTPTDLTSITLTAGDWDVFGNSLLLPTGTVSIYQAAINTTSATLPDASLKSVYQLATVSGSALGFAVPSIRLSLAVTTIVYLVASITFSTGTATQAGSIWARRAR